MTILAAIDFSPVTDTVLKELAEFARPNENITLIHIAEPDPDFVGFDVGPDVLKTQIENENQRSKKRLDLLAKDLSKKGLQVKTMQPQGIIAAEILSAADKVNARIIVLGSHGHSALFDLLVGSVAESVINQSTKPVLLVPAPKK